MTRIAYVILCSCLLAVIGFIAQPASAGSRDYGYRDDGYYVHVVHPRPRPRPRRAWYSSECCYMKIVRHVGHERQERFVKVSPARMKRAWLEQQRELAARHERLPERVSHADKLDRHAEYKVIVVRRNGKDDQERCHHRRVRVLKPDGGWTWALEAQCD